MGIHVEGAVGLIDMESLTVQKFRYLIRQKKVGCNGTKLNLADPLLNHPSQAKVLAKYSKQKNGSHVKVAVLKGNAHTAALYNKLICRK